MTSGQRKTLVLSALGIAVFGLFFLGLLFWFDGWPGPLPDPGERVALALKFSVLPAGFLLLVIFAVSLSRLLTGAADALNDDPPRWRAVDMRVLANTVEQTLVFLPLYLAMAMVLKAGEGALLAALPIVFVSARVMFWVGYRIGTYGRAPGMAAGMALNIGMLGFIVLRALG